MPVGCVAGIQPDTVEAEGDEAPDHGAQGACCSKQQLHKAGGGALLHCIARVLGYWSKTMDQPVKRKLSLPHCIRTRAGGFTYTSEISVEFLSSKVIAVQGIYAPAKSLHMSLAYCIALEKKHGWKEIQHTGTAESPDMQQPAEMLTHMWHHMWEQTSLLA